MLIPLGGSTRSERALPVAANIARNSGASILLLRIVDLTREAGIYGLVPSPALESVAHQLRVAAETYLVNRAV